MSQRTLKSFFSLCTYIHSMYAGLLLYDAPFLGKSDSLASCYFVDDKIHFWFLLKPRRSLAVQIYNGGAC